ncbi:hypothetical protein RUND412_005941 [Rhizina undulata]
MASPLPPFTTFSTSPQTQILVLSTLFEPSPALTSHPQLQTVLETAGSYTDLIDSIEDLLLSFQQSDNAEDAETLLQILGAHPRLGARKVESVHSIGEQKSLAAEDEEVRVELERLNREYEERFPGMRYVVFVNARPRSVIIEDMKRRIARGDIELEKTEAIYAMRDIAKDRASKLQG